MPDVTAVVCVICESFDTGQLELGMGMASPQVHSWYDSPKHSSIFFNREAI